MPEKREGKLFVVSGPSGVGKSTVISKVMAHREDLCFSVSVTTRAPRPDEQEGVNYFYRTQQEFDRMIAQEELLEHAEYVGHSYGTPRAYVDQKRREGMHVLLDIEVQGAGQVRNRVPDAVKIFVIPPSLAVLEQRLRGRKTDDEEAIQSRLERAKKEYSEAIFYDYIIVNDDVDVAAKELESVITAELCRYDERKHYLNSEESSFLNF